MADRQPTVSILPPDVANKIAAGEVVERPASVVKELVENALDAGATRITIEVEGGGRSLLRVADDGCGMSRADATLAVQRHATSKIRTARDIDAIATLGFRGEALPSIAAVSQFELLTCPRGASSGTRIVINGGSSPEISDASRATGTTVTARNLFYCVPARAKFLKTTATELSHIARLVHNIAIAFPHVGFSYTVDKQLHFDLPPQPPHTPFLDALRTRLIQLRGQALVDDLLPLEHSYEQISVCGFTSSFSRSVLTRQELYFFVNQRPVRAAWLPALVKRAYGSLLASDRYPYSFVFLSLPFNLVDVNIHPTKQEVRFGNEFAVQSAVSMAITNALHAHQEAPRVALAPASRSSAPTSAPLPQPQSAETRVAPSQPPRAPWSRKLTVEEWKKLYGPPPASPVATQPLSTATSAPAPTTAAQRLAPTTDDVIRAVGQIGDAYILAEISGTRNGLVIIDQHAAHERINFDRVLSAFSSSPAPSQALLLPATLHLKSDHAALIAAHLDDLRHMGFSIEDFGPDTFKIDAVPAYLPLGNLNDLFADMAAELLAAGRTQRPDELRRRMALVLVCRTSLKFHQHLSLAEMQALIDDLRATSTPWTCPHGRPTMIVIPFDELTKRFGRT
ncbi:MAG: DNA mismatch repair endonuclease MutL [bacterium]|nr:DNA mismatch repair endonuclease MutL [bacterium]